MRFVDTFITALDTLRKNAVRSFLTMLGIILGVFAVVSLVALVQGVKNFVTSEFVSLGSNLILVAPGRFRINQDPALTFANNKLTEKDADTIQRQASEYIVGVTPNIRTGKSATYKNKSFLANITAVNAVFADITNAKIEKGRFFNKAEESAGEKVAVIGAQVAKSLFLTDDPIGKNIQIDDVSFKVVGVNKTGGWDFDERIIIPLKAAKLKLGVKNLSGLTIRVKDGVDVNKTMLQIELALLQNHDKDDFSVVSQKDILTSFQNVLRSLSIGLGTVAGISLLVGGIGIMNIMLVSVNERVSEIGLRKAIGATPKNIAVQFIIEASVLSMIGGILGIAMSYLLTLGLASFVKSEIPTWIVAISFGFSILVGVGFGTYPALIAAKKDPIEALRYET